MSDIWKYFTNLFNAAEESSSTQPFIHELIERTDTDKEDYEHWKKTLVKRRLINWLNSQHIAYLINPNDIDESIDFLNLTSSKGFVVHFQKMGYTKAEGIHFFDYLKERVLTLGYRSYVSDFRTYQKKDWIETTQRHYLKPRPNFLKEKNEKFNQAYGNINIELILRNEKLIQLKFSATSYNDRKFEDADEFNDLMQELLEN